MTVREICIYLFASLLPARIRKRQMNSSSLKIQCSAFGKHILLLGDVQSSSKVMTTLAFLAFEHGFSGYLIKR